MFRSRSNHLLILPVLALMMGSVSSATDESLWQRLGRATWVAEGARSPQHLFYVVTDANCPYCHELWKELQPFYPKGLAVRYVMVGILADSSPGKAAAILESRDPVAALDRDERGWARLPDDMGGGIPPLAHPKPRTLAELQDNQQLMSDLGVQGTPALIYTDVHGALHVIQCVPDPAALPGIIRDAGPR